MSVYSGRVVLNVLNRSSYVFPLSSFVAHF
uniref:Uncharacterized protein n=1 Tax=Anguilla anguilla TaxID=7936 RepID=A0A0E9QNQ0_ANGAN